MCVLRCRNLQLGRNNLRRLVGLLVMPDRNVEQRWCQRLHCLPVGNLRLHRGFIAMHSLRQRDVQS